MKRNMFILFVFIGLVAFSSISFASTISATGTVSTIRSYSSSQNAICFNNSSTSSVQCFVVPTETTGAMLAIALTAATNNSTVVYAWDSASTSLLYKIQIQAQ